MQRIVGRASCRELGGLAACSPGLCRWKSALTCRKQPVVHQQWAGVCVRPARPFSGEQGRKLCRARFVFAVQKHRLFGSQPEDDNSPKSYDNPPKSPADLPLVAVVRITDPITWLWCEFLIFFINLRFDLEIGSPEFSKGVKQAFSHISNLMSSGQYDRLEGIVSKETIEHIEAKCGSLSDARKQLLAVTRDDILAALPENVSLAFDDGKKFCSISLRFWFLTTPDDPDDPAASIFEVRPREDGMPQRKIASAVVDFQSEVSPGASPDWTVTSVWHWHWHWKEAE